MDKQIAKLIQAVRGIVHECDGDPSESDYPPHPSWTTVAALKEALAPFLTATDFLMPNEFHPNSVAGKAARRVIERKLRG